MEKIVKWTDEEDKILVQAIKANPHNKAKAIKSVLSRLNNRTIDAAKYRWYGVLSNPAHPKYVGCLFVMTGRGTKYNNRTIFRENARIIPEKSTASIWTKIKKLLKF